MSRERSTRERVRSAFASLRRQGFVTRSAFLCCNSCAGAALDTPENQGKAGVFYSRQGAEAWVRGELRCGLYLNYGIIGGRDTAGDVVAGHRLVEALRAQDVEVQWNGSVSECVLILPRKAEVVAADLTEEEAESLFAQMEPQFREAAGRYETPTGWEIRASAAVREEALRRIRFWRRTVPVGQRYAERMRIPASA